MVLPNETNSSRRLYVLWNASYNDTTPFDTWSRLLRLPTGGVSKRAVNITLGYEL